MYYKLWSLVLFLLLYSILLWYRVWTSAFVNEEECGNERCATQEVVVAIATACLWRGIDTMRCRISGTLAESRRLPSVVSSWKHTSSGWH